MEELEELPQSDWPVVISVKDLIFDWCGRVQTICCEYHLPRPEIYKMTS